MESRNPAFQQLVHFVTLDFHAALYVLLIHFYALSPFLQPDPAYLQSLEMELQEPTQTFTSTQDEFNTTMQDAQINSILEYIAGCTMPSDGDNDTQESCAFLNNINWKCLREVTESKSNIYTYLIKLITFQ